METRPVVLPKLPLKLFWLLSLCCALGGCKPSSRSSAAESELRINEVMARNASLAVPDENGRPIVQDWVELYNRGDVPLPLTGFTLSDDLRQPAKFRFPAGSRVAPGGFVIVYVFNRSGCEPDCDAELAACLEPPSPAVPGEPPVALTEDEIAACEAEHEDCALSCNPAGFVADFGFGSRDTVYLFAGGGRVLIDRVGVSDPDANLSIGRYPDGSGTYGVHYAGATPGRANLPTDMAPPSISRIDLSTTIPDCGESVEVAFDVTVDSDQLGASTVHLEFAEASCAESPPAGWSSEGVTLVAETSRAAPAVQRANINAALVEVPRSTISYRGSVPGADCGVSRWIRVSVEQEGLGPQVRGAGCVSWDADQQLPTVRINEYVPRNTELRFVITQSGGNQIFERPDWIELVNYGAEPVDISKFGLVGLGRWTRFNSGERDTLEPWTLVDERYTDADVSFSQVILEPGCHLVLLTDGDGPPFRRGYRLVNDQGTRDESGFGGDLSCQLEDGDGAVFLSTDFRLAATQRDLNEEDGFVLVDPQNRFLDQVAISLQAIDDSFLELNSDGELQIKANVAFGRLPIEEETFEEPLGVGRVLCVPTPGSGNTLLCEVPPRFAEAVTIRPRNPRAGEPVEVRGRVNFDTARADSGQVTAVDDLLVELHFETPAGGGVLRPGAGLMLSTEGVNQVDAAAASTLWEFVAQLPGQPAGTFVTFFLRAQDLSAGGDSREVIHDEQTAPEISFQYLVGFEARFDHPKISEVLPRNASTPLPPFAGAETPRFHDYVEIHNPSRDVLDLSGYYLAQSAAPASQVLVAPFGTVPIRRARRWRFPDGASVPAGGVRVVYFGAPPSPAPSDYLEADFSLACAEALYLIAPDGPERGANSVVDGVTWNFIRDDPDSPCREDIARARLCGGTSAFADAAPTPGRANFDGLLPPEFHSAYHSDLFDNETNHCVAAAGPGAQVNLNAVIFLDAALVDALNPARNQPSAIIEARAIIVELGDGSEDRAVGSMTFFDCGLTGGQCEPAPAGQTSVRIQRLINLSGIGADVVRYRVEARDVCGNALEAGPFSVATAAAPKPPLRINEVNLSFPLFETPRVPRPWVELVNRSADQEVDASGMFITDNPQFPQKARLPEGLRVPPNGFAVVALDVFDHSFALEGASGRLSLIDSVERGSCEVDAFAADFRGVPLGTSIGRVPDGSGGARVLDAPSPGASNALGALFVRGDANEDGKVSLPDMVEILAILFSGQTRRPTCEDALDADDSGDVALNDAVFIGNYLFRSGETIPPPYPNPGTDPTPDELPCPNS